MCAYKVIDDRAEQVRGTFYKKKKLINFLKILA